MGREGEGELYLGVGGRGGRGMGRDRRGSERDMGGGVKVHFIYRG